MSNELLHTALKACTLTAGKKDVRQFLNGVHVYRVDINALSDEGVKDLIQQTYIESSNGHMLCRVLFKREGFSLPADFDAILELSDLKKALTLHKMKDLCLLSVSPLGLKFGCVPINVIEGRFPDLQGLIPSGVEAEGVSTSVLLDGGYVEILGKVAKLFKQRVVLSCGDRQILGKFENDDYRLELLAQGCRK